jgi:hypothetical protein
MLMTYENIDILEGAVDMHIHAKPDFHPRIADELAILQHAKEYGMRALVSKSHYVPNADRLTAINSQIEDIECFGGIVLNPTVGGLNPLAVEASIRFGGKVVWMPSFYTQAHLEKFPEFKAAVPAKPPAVSAKPPAGEATARAPGDPAVPAHRSEKAGGMCIIRDGKLVPEMYEILQLIAENNVILATSHCSESEIVVLVREAKKEGVKKIVITHPYCPTPNLNLEKQTELAEMGAYLELCLFSAMPISGKVTIRDFAATIKSAGTERVVLATDFGQPFHPMPAEGMRIFCNGLMAVGIPKKDIITIIKENPYYLLGL